MLTYRIFLASSSELDSDRKSFENFLARFNDDLYNQHKHVRFELKIWERADTAIFETRKQDEYNLYLDICDLFVLLYWTKMGKYSEEEFDIAYARFKETGKPKIYTYKKTTDQPATVPAADRQSLSDFEIKLSGSIGHFTDHYQSENDLTAKFKTVLDYLFVSGYLQYGKPAILLSPNGVSDPSVFLGREEELKLIREKLDKGGKLLLINAEGGIGKTTLAAKYWNETLNEYKYNAWLFCENGIINALKELAPKLNVDLSNLDEQQQLKALKHGLSRVHDDFLLVLDNANEENEIRLFRQEFEGFHWHVLLTSRCKGVLDQSQELHIIHLLPPLAKELFEKNYKEVNPEFDRLVDWLLKSINYHTLLIDIFSKNLKKASKNGLDLKSFIEKLESENLFLGEDSFEIQTDYAQTRKRKAATTDEILEILYDFTRLEEYERFVLVNIALLPAESYTDQFLLDLAGLDDIRNKKNRKSYLNTLEALFHNGWLSGEVNEDYRISPVVQKLVLNKNSKNQVNDSKRLLKTLNTKLKNDGYNFVNIQLSEANKYVKLIRTVHKYLKNHPTYDLAFVNYNTGVFYDITGLMDNAENSFQRYQDVINQLLIQHPTDEVFNNSLSISYGKLGEIFQIKGDWERGLDQFQKALKICIWINEQSPENPELKTSVATSYSKLGGIYESIGDMNNALSNFKAAFKIYVEVSKKDPENLLYKNNLAIMYSRLANIYQAIGEWNDAIKNFEESFKINKELSEKSPSNISYKINLSISYEKLGDLFKIIGEPMKSLSNYQLRNKISKKIFKSSPENLDYKNGLATSFSKLGDFYGETGDWNNAFINYQEAIKLSKEINESNPENLEYKYILAITYSNIGDIYKLKNDWKNALDYYLKKNQINIETSERSPENLQYKSGLTVSYSKLGDTYLIMGNLKLAMDHHQKALRLANEILAGSPENVVYKNGLAIAIEKIGDVYRATGDLDNALIYYKEDVRISTEVSERSPENISYKNGLASALVKSAEVIITFNQNIEGLKYCIEAQKIFKGIILITKNQIVSYVFNYAWTCWKVVTIFKKMTSYDTKHFSKTEIIQIGKEGYDALKPLADDGLLQENQKGILTELGDAGWYAF